MGGDGASDSVRLYGTDEEPAAIRRFAIGPLTFDLEAGKIRYVRFAGFEALRSIAFIVRGPSWESPPPTISDLQCDETGTALRIGYQASYATEGGELEVAAVIDAAADGTLAFTATARALTDFTTARASFCILHPLAGVAGQPFDLTRPDETVEPARFPDLISAHQPFMNIRALSHQVAPGIRATIRMEGDVWEMEDQRNWTDASFKTYGRPRDLPWPFTIAKGETIVQRAILTIARSPSATRVRVAAEIAIRMDGTESGRLPQVALALAPECLKMGVAQAPALGFRPHELIAWYEHGVQDPGDLAAFAELGRRYEAAVGLELVLPCKAPLAHEMAEASAQLARAGLVPSSLLPIQAPMTKWVLKRPEEMGLPSFTQLYEAARAHFPGVPIGAGVTSNFTEFNIDRPDLEGADFVTHGTAAVIHDPDDRSVMETLETLPHIFRSVRAIAGARPYRLGPSAIGMRYNPYGKSTDPNTGSRRVAFARHDPRQRGLFGAAFALGYFARAVEAGIDVVCLGAPTGPFGIVYQRAEYPQPWFDGLAAPAVYPIFHPLSALAQAREAPVFAVRSSEPKRVLALAHGQGKGMAVLWLANLTPEPQRVHVEGAPFRPKRLRHLDRESFALATRDPATLAASARAWTDGEVTLGPYAVAALDGALGK